MRNAFMNWLLGPEDKDEDVIEPLGENEDSDENDDDEDDDDDDEDLDE